MALTDRRFLLAVAAAVVIWPLAHPARARQPQAQTQTREPASRAVVVLMGRAQGQARQDFIAWVKAELDRESK